MPVRLVLSYPLAFIRSYRRKKADGNQPGLAKRQELSSPGQVASIARRIRRPRRPSGAQESRFDATRSGNWRNQEIWIARPWRRGLSRRNQVEQHLERSLPHKIRRL